MSTNPPKISLIDLCLTGPIADLLKQKDGYKQIDPALLKSLCAEIMDYQRSFPWNAYNSVKVCGKDPEDVPGYQKHRAMPSSPRPFASWLEFSVQYLGGLSDHERESPDYYIPYVIEHTYKPDNNSILNDRIIIETKGAIRSLEEARKYVAVSRQYDVHFVFVLQCRNIECPWQCEKKDGTKMMHEEWCTKNGFDYTYQGEEKDFLNSERFKVLVENVGKGLGSFKEELQAKREEVKNRKAAYIEKKDLDWQ